MVFSSLYFLFFFLPLVLFVYYILLRKQDHRNHFLLGSSLIFYAWGEPVFVFLMIGSVVANYTVGLLIAKQRETLAVKAQKWMLFLGILLNFIPFFLLKYEFFLVEQCNKILMALSLPTLVSLELPLPIGISFFTFQAISYLVDVSRGTVPVQKNILHLGLYISFFPQLVAGPIVRYSTIAAQIEDRTTTPADFHQGIQRFIQGFSKKIIFANQIGIMAEESFATEQPTIFLAWLGAVAFALQVYYDFSGYSDMAIGLGKMFGFHFMENFNIPYVSSSFTEYWKRCHISLSQWFRDYVYIPLGGSRVSPRRLFCNQLLIWLLTGFWHGASYQFVAWGLWQFFFLSLENHLIHPEKFQKKGQKSCYRCFTLTMLVVGLVFFGETSSQGAVQHLFYMFSGETEWIHPSDLYLLLKFWHILFLGILFAVKDWREPDPALSKITAKLSPLAKETLSTGYYFGLLVVSVSFLAVDAHNPFIYFNF